MRLKLCFVCLGQGHRRERCPKRKSNQFWNALLAGDAVPAGNACTKQASSAARSNGTDSTEAKVSLSRSQNEKAEDGSEEGTSPVGIHLSSTEGQTTIRLPVVSAMAHGEKGKTKLVKCLLDSESERSLIRTDVADELDLQGPTGAMTVKGVNGLHVRIAEVRRVRFRLTPIPSEGLEPFNEGIELTALSLPSLCDDLIHIIIGLDAYFQVLGQGVRRGGPNDSVAIETIFGWIVCGPTTRQAVDREETTLLAQPEDRLSRLLRQFWEMEALGILPSTEDAKFEPALTQFEESVSFDGQRYSVGLLWKAGVSPLPNNFEMAKRRLRSLRHRLAQDPEKEREYADVIQSYLDQGWAEHVPDESGPIGMAWYLPHHAVYQGGPGKAKCRVVLDGSAEMNGASLNRCLDPGPKLQPDLADIEKMYLQIGLRPKDRDVCRFLWQAAGSKSPARIYRLTQVGFGLSCSPFLAMRVIRHHAQSHGKIKALADKVLSDMYVDDLATSCDRIEEAQTLIRQLCNLMKSGGFAMKKWASHDPAALSDLPMEISSPLETSRLWKTLGLYWNRRLDVQTFVPPAEIHLGRHDTKRQLVSLAAKVFDPFVGSYLYSVLTSIFGIKFHIRYFVCCCAKSISLLERDQPPPFLNLPPYRMLRDELDDQILKRIYNNINYRYHFL
ncbi:hypothetical protein T11_2446 [Trichinella zimbabwensis]|uniref:Peptidase aspartic putative domain-containing protein n=1 Tax=Trichinella zimbabwensis TaxID=268475 RepID=A0A0V1H3Z0_9BILA|nr:hypothetical protein T11_2446 [Trichinella zimbabwensis]